jgi:hypothetical protein
VDYIRRIVARSVGDGMIELRLTGEWGKGLVVYPSEFEEFIREVKEGKWDDPRSAQAQKATEPEVQSPS